MIKNPRALELFEKEFQRKEGRFTFEEALLLFESLWQEALSLSVIPLKDPLEGIETDIKIASILNACSRSSLKD